MGDPLTSELLATLLVTTRVAAWTCAAAAALTVVLVVWLGWQEARTLNRRPPASAAKARSIKTTWSLPGIGAAARQHLKNGRPSDR